MEVLSLGLQRLRNLANQVNRIWQDVYAALGSGKYPAQPRFTAEKHRLGEETFDRSSNIRVHHLC
jgi:hypothetical protein